MAYPNVTMKVSPPAHAAVTEVRREMSDSKLETLSYSDTLLELVRHWKETQRQASDAREAGR